MTNQLINLNTTVINNNNNIPLLKLINLNQQHQAINNFLHILQLTHFHHIQNNMNKIHLFFQSQDLIIINNNNNLFFLNHHLILLNHTNSHHQFHFSILIGHSKFHNFKAMINRLYFRMCNQQQIHIKIKKADFLQIF